MAKKILIADDEPNIVTALEFLIERAGYEVRTAANGDEALAAIAQDPPDLVLLDIMMPVKSGYEVCKRIRDQPEWGKVKVVMLSAKGRDAEVTKGLAMGADLYVTKPFSTRELLSQIRTLLGG